MATAQDGTFYPRPPSMDPSPAEYVSEHYNYDAKPEPSAFQQPPISATSNSKSYASRAGPRPDLFVDTTPPLQAPATQSLTSPNNQYNLPSASSAAQPTRKGSVSDRSPLQNLEVKLGDISKEEKRARIEQAESLARQLSTTNRAPSNLAPAGSSTQEVSRRPTTSSGHTRSQRSAATGVPSGLGDVLSPTRVPTTSYDSARPRVRSYGYDSSLTGGAAAAAVGAYQASRRRQYEARSTSAGTYNSSAAQTGMRNAQVQYTAKSKPSSGSGETGQGVMSERQLQGQETANISSLKDVNAYQQPGPFQPNEVRPVDYNRPSAAFPPQTAAGQQVRKQVAFQTDDLNETTMQDHEGSDRHGFRSMFHRNQQTGRKFEKQTFLNEWKLGGAAILSSADLDLDTGGSGGNDQAWWEQSESQRRYQGQVNEASNDNVAATTFSPPLTLKCGPLLRYTGMRLDPHTEQEFWRGSVMIVAQDSTSSYEVTPVLRLFKQSMDLVPPPPQGTVHEQNGHNEESANVDPIAGLPKISRTGQTLFVKHVHEVRGEIDLSQLETDEGLFHGDPPANDEENGTSRIHSQDGEKRSRFREVKAVRLHSERGCTFWRFNLQVELSATENRVAYRINGGPAIGFWVPARGQAMNVMFHSCNGFSLSVNSNEFSGPDPLWRDVLNNHQIRPFHCMIGGGDQIYNDSAMKQTQHFQEWLAVQSPEDKHSADFSVEMQNELEQFYLDRYSMWFSQGLFGMANSQIPMVNLWDDHDIIDGFGSYPHHFMSTPVFSGIGAVAFKYYMLFQHQSVVDESEETEPSWLLGSAPGPYINELSRSVFLSLGKGVSFLGIDCRTERMRDEVLSQGTYDQIFDRCRREIVPGETKHLIVLLGVPIAYPRLNFLENVLTSRAMDPIKALGRAGMFSGLINKFDGGVEILDDLDDHWTAKHHKHERNWFIQELQELAAEKSVRIIILGGDVHLAAVGQFYSNPKLGIPKDHDHRYMPNVISSAIVNTPPPEMMADVLNKRNKVHHLDKDTDEDMIPMFLHDVTGKSRNNNHLLPRRNWCSIREYHPGSTPPSTPPPEQEESGGKEEERPARRRSFSFSRSRSRTRSDGEKRSLLRRFSTRKAPPSSYHGPNTMENESTYSNSSLDRRFDGPLDDRMPSSMRSSEDTTTEERGRQPLPRSNSFHRRPTTLTRRASKKDSSGREGHIDLQGGLDIVINCEIDQRDPAGFTVPYRLIVPALFHQGSADTNTANIKNGSGIGGFLGSFRRQKESSAKEDVEGVPYDAHEIQSTPPLGGRAMPESAMAGQRSLSTQNDEVLTDHDLPSSQPPPTFRGDVPTLLEDGSNGPRSRRSAPASASFQEAATSQRQARSSMDVPQNFPNRSASAREPEARTAQTFRRYSASGPPPPENIDQLPASVRKRYTELNDPSLKQYTQATEPPRRRYSQMNDPAGHKRYSQYEPLSRSLPGSQRRPEPAPRPRPEDTHRRYSSAPMEMPLLPTNINQLRSSTHRTLQSADPTSDEPVNQRSVSDPQTESATAAYNKALPAIGGNGSGNFEQAEAPSRPATYNGGYSSTATAPSMVPLSRGQAKRGSKIPAYPSPLTSHAPQRESYQTPEDSPNLSPRLAATNTTRPVGREYDDEAYGYRHSADMDPSRGSRGYSHGGMPEKVARHFGGYDGTAGQNREYDDGRGSRKSGGGGLSGLMRRFSESAGVGKRERENDERYNEDWNREEESGDDHDDYYDKRSSWKFWQH